MIIINNISRNASLRTVHSWHNSGIMSISSPELIETINNAINTGFSVKDRIELQNELFSRRLDEGIIGTPLFITFSVLLPIIDVMLHWEVRLCFLLGSLSYTFREGIGMCMFLESSSSMALCSSRMSRYIWHFGSTESILEVNMRRPRFVGANFLECDF